MSEMIALKGLGRRFGPLVAVDDISLSVNRGEVLGFLGPNGAGKSTTMKMITGFLTPSSGTATVSGFDVVEQPVEVKKRIGYLPEGAPTYGDMTPATFLNFIAEVRGLKGEEKTRRLIEVTEKVSLGEVLRQPIETLSKGFKRRVGLAQAILHDPEVLILDEPTDGLDPNQKHHVRKLIREMAKDKAIIISTHVLEEVEAVCTRAAIIARGRLLADGTAEELQARAANHNAVGVRVAAEHEGAARAALEPLGVEIVEIAGDGAFHLRVPAKAGVPPLKEAAEALDAKNAPYQQLGVEKGRLDDVFRAITTEGEGGVHAA